MRIHARVSAVAIFLVASILPSVRAQAPASIGCTHSKNSYACDKIAFENYLKTARTVAIEPQSAVHNSEPQLRDLARSLGKTPQPAPADMAFQLIPVDFDGVNYGPGDRELATLRIYTMTPQGTRGPLIWVENLYGQPDMPWPTVVHAIIQQFKTDLK
jgi:hypothetical protein